MDSKIVPRVRSPTNFQLAPKKERRSLVTLSRNTIRSFVGATVKRLAETHGGTDHEVTREDVIRALPQTAGYPPSEAWEATLDALGRRLEMRKFGGCLVVAPRATHEWKCFSADERARHTVNLSPRNSKQLRASLEWEIASAKKRIEATRSVLSNGEWVEVLCLSSIYPCSVNFLGDECRRLGFLLERETAEMRRRIARECAGIPTASSRCVFLMQCTTSEIPPAWVENGVPGEFVHSIFPFFPRK